jgi:hypothetical protein
MAAEGRDDLRKVWKVMKNVGKNGDPPASMSRPVGRVLSSGGVADPEAMVTQLRFQGPCARWTSSGPGTGEHDRLYTPGMDPMTLLTVAFAAGLRSTASALIESVLAVARRPILLLLATLAFVSAAATLLTLSAVVFTGWWQEFSLELGVGLLIAGVVDVAILSLLNGLIEGGAHKRELRDIRETTHRIELLLAPSKTAADSG